MNKRRIGSEYEKKAVGYLKKQGLTVLETNFRNRYGEIDIICRDGEFTVFVEVKYRSSTKNGDPAESVNYAKQKNICKVADYYRIIHKMGEYTPIRYDVITFLGTEIKWYKNAFNHVYTTRNRD